LIGVEYLGADQLAPLISAPQARLSRVLVRLPARMALPADGHALSWPETAEHHFGPNGLRLTTSGPEAKGAYAC
jgi:hypothetical protein